MRNTARASHGHAPNWRSLCKIFDAETSWSSCALDRLARSVRHLLETIDRLEEAGAHFRSLRDPIDTSTAQGMFSLQVLGAVAQLERALISERTKAGLQASRARGRIGGNPGLRAGDAKAIRKLAAARDRTYVRKLLAGVDMWLPTVVRMRPDHPWHEVVRALNSRAGEDWNVERLRRCVKRLVGEGMIPARLLDRAPVRSAEDHLLMLVAGVALADPGKTLQQIGAQLEAMHQRAPRGGVRWSPSSVKNLLDRALRRGLLPAIKAPSDHLRDGPPRVASWLRQRIQPVTFNARRCRGAVPDVVRHVSP
jgi:hypothetical protein